MNLSFHFLDFSRILFRLFSTNFYFFTLKTARSLPPLIRYTMQTAVIINIGDEILLGQIINTNAAWMAESLSEIGVQVVQQIVVSDDAPAIREALLTAHEKANLILLTGGLGPTKDDITKKVLADFYNTDLVLDENLHERLQLYFSKLGRKATAAHKIQCYMPVNAEQLENKMGTAPGMLFRQKGSLTVSLPGVPYEMKYLMENEVIPRLQRETKGLHLERTTILTVGRGESQIAELVEDLEDALPRHIKLAYLPHLARVRLRLTSTGTDASAVRDELHKWKDKFVDRLGNLVYGFNRSSLAQSVQELMIEKGKTLVTAESCTGGNIARHITAIAGSSQFFTGGVVAYSNSLKINLLDVSKVTLQEFGAVSEATVREMVIGASRKLGADIAVASSGIAGPGGGTKEKPVGTVWLACGNADRVIVKKLQLNKNRALNIEYSTMWALNLVRRFLMAL
jgi:nicotinamide-nucleotide amidase